MTEKTPPPHNLREQSLEKTVNLSPSEALFDVTQEIPREAVEMAQRQEVLKEIDVKTHTYQFLNYALATRTGIAKKRMMSPRKKEVNEDSGIIGDTYLAVADGMGSKKGAKEASTYVLSLFEDAFKDRVPTGLEGSIERGQTFVRNAQTLTAKMLEEEGFGFGSGTTFNGAVVEMLPLFRQAALMESQAIETTERSGDVFITNIQVGDSHAYIQRTDGSLELITPDEDRLSDILRRKLNTTQNNTVRTMRRKLQNELDGIPEAEHARFLSEYYSFSDEEIKEYTDWGHTITYAIGSLVDDKPLVTFTHLLPGERLIIVSDGLDTLTKKEKEEIMRNAPDPETASKELILRAALKAQQNDTREDDMTVAILQNDFHSEKQIPETE